MRTDSDEFGMNFHKKKEEVTANPGLASLQRQSKALTLMRC
jgi:hypothetical protein